MIICLCDGRVSARLGVSNVLACIQGRFIAAFLPVLKKLEIQVLKEKEEAEQELEIVFFEKLTRKR
jgi:hypothetical protein